MRRVLYLFLPSWAIDRLRRGGLLPSHANGEKPASRHLISIKPPEAAPSQPLRGSSSPVATGEGWGGGQHHRKSIETSAEEPPFATVIAVSGRQILAAVNPAAAAGGIAAGMPLAD